MSGIIAVYALVVAVLIAGDMGPPPTQNYSLFKYDFPTQATGIEISAWANKRYQWIHASCLWTICWLDWSRGWIRNRDRRRYGSTIIHVAIKDLRRNGIDSHFRRGSGSIWSYRGVDSQHQEQCLRLKSGTQDPKFHGKRPREKHCLSNEKEHCLEFWSCVKEVIDRSWYSSVRCTDPMSRSVM